jgi:glucosamine-6-phosphate deaminase
MLKPLTMLNTIKGSLLESFYPRGWDLARMDRCCAMGAKKLTTRGRHWNSGFRAQSVPEMAPPMGLEIARVIEQSRKQRRNLAMILPVGPVSMYDVAVARLKERNIKCDHVMTFNMDEWSDRRGNTMPGDQPGGFEYTMGKAFFEPLGRLTVPKNQRNFALKSNLPTYGEKIAALKRDGAMLVTVYGVGRTCHIAFWEPHFAEQYPLGQWKQQTHALGVALHPLTIEQNSLHSFNSRFTLIPCWANTIGPGLFLQSDWCIGGAEGAYPQFKAQWQGMSTCVTLQYGPSPWLPSTFMPTLPGRFYFTKELGGPLLAV